MEFQLTMVAYQGSETEAYLLSVTERKQELGRGKEAGTGVHGLGSVREVLKENWLQTVVFSRLIQNMERQLKKIITFSQKLSRVPAAFNPWEKYNITEVVKEVRNGGSAPSTVPASPVWPRSHPIFFLDEPSLLLLLLHGLLILLSPLLPDSRPCLYITGSRVIAFPVGWWGEALNLRDPGGELTAVVVMGKAHCS